MRMAPMNHLFDDWRFWAAIACATLFKLLTSINLNWLTASATVLAAFFVPLTFTEPVMHLFNLEPVYRVPTAILLTLTGEGTMRWLIKVTPDRLIQIVKDWRK
jgi:hypothetical protein